MKPSLKSINYKKEKAEPFITGLKKNCEETISVERQPDSVTQKVIPVLC